MSLSVLATDAYKLSMAEAGFPLRTETFYYSHRRGGPFFLPFDADEVVRALRPEAPSAADVAFLEASGYRPGGALLAALRGSVQVDALPRGSWFHDREPAFSITGPSALVSWLEPLVLQLHYRIQVASLALLEPERLPTVVGTVTCEAQRERVLETLDAVGVAAPPIRVDTEGYVAHVRSTVRELVEVVGDPSRIFEVGMRAASCLEQHQLAVEACAAEGVRSTSNVLAAQALGLKAVGTMGHEHVQRFGADEAAFRAMRDRRAGPTSFLLDTYATLDSGLPTALDLIAEDPSRRDSVRFDSGDKELQLEAAWTMARERRVRPRFILEDGLKAADTRSLEGVRARLGIPAEDVLYGYGGTIVRAPGDPLTRDRVSAVYKLCQSGPTPTMKLGDEPGGGKTSIPGEPVLLRRTGPGPAGLVLQQGEAPTEAGVVLTGRGDPLPTSIDEVRARAAASPGPLLSPATRALADRITSAHRPAGR